MKAAGDTSRASRRAFRLAFRGPGMPGAMAPVLACAICALSCGESPGSSSTGDPDATGRLDAAPAEGASGPDGPLQPADAGPDTGRGPPYPLVLVHGFFGFDKIGPVQYFWKVKAALESDGHVVEVTTVDPFNSTYVRGEQLLTQVKALLGKTGAAKVNIIGHSQGGLDARYVAAKLPGQVASVTTISTPHLGAKVADVLLQSTPGFTQELAKAFFAALSRPFYGDVAKDADMKACLEFLSSASLTQFNTDYPDLESITYFSIGGRSNSRLAKTECYAPLSPPFVTKYDNVKDPIEPLLFLTAKLLDESLLHPVDNDGIVQTKKTRWGTWLGCIPADHFDQVGQLFGDSPGAGNTFDHITFYRELAAFLRTKGL